MDNNHSHPNVALIINKAKAAYSIWLNVHRNIPKTERLNLGQNISETFLLVLRFCFVAAYSPTGEKITFIDKAIAEHDILKFFVQIAWENKLIPDKKYIDFSNKLSEVGCMLGGWKKDQSKTPAK